MSLADVAAVASLLHEGFDRTPESYFKKILVRLADWNFRQGLPHFGYVLDQDGDIVGTLLTIGSRQGEEAAAIFKSNVSCWYAKRQYRVYAPLLLSRAAKMLEATIVNISPHRDTWKIIEAQGFRQFSHHAFAFLPILAVPRFGTRVVRIKMQASDFPGLSPYEMQVLRDHDSFDCISLICKIGTEIYPFVFRRRKQKWFPLPFAELIYCRSVGDITECAGPIGRFLAGRGMLWAVAAVDDPFPHLTGMIFKDRKVMYFRGLDRPRPGDISYTEAAMFGL